MAAIFIEDEQDLGAAASLEAATEEDSIARVWSRSCPQCQALLIKASPWLFVVCACGWQWQS